jgi:hypothetical protein
MKVRVNLTTQDYFSYVGTNPYYSLPTRVIHSLPSELREGYNMKFKRLKAYGNYYRVHISVKVEDISIISNLEDRYKSFGLRPTNVSWKVIKSHKTV